jgi:hypothetical protein
VALVLLAAALRLPAQNLLDDGWDHFYNLEYDPAIADFQRAIAQDPTPPICTITSPKPSSSKRCTAMARSKAKWSPATIRCSAAPA